MIKKYKKFKFILDPVGLIKAENEYIAKIKRESQNRKNKKKQPITKKSLDALEIYLDPTPLTPEEQEDHQKRMTNILRKYKIIELLEELNLDLLPSKEKKELIAVLKKVLAKYNFLLRRKITLKKSGKTKYKQTLTSKKLFKSQKQ